MSQPQDAHAGNKVGRGIGDAIKGVFNTAHGLGEVTRGNINQALDNSGEGLRDALAGPKKKQDDASTTTSDATSTTTSGRTTSSNAPTDAEVRAKSTEHRDVANTGLEEVKKGWDQITGQSHYARRE